MIYIRKRNETNVIESIILEIYKPINLQTYKIILRQLFNENITSLSSLQLWTILKLCKNITKQNACRNGHKLCRSSYQRLLLPFNFAWFLSFFTKILSRTVCVKKFLFTKRPCLLQTSIFWTVSKSFSNLPCKHKVQRLQKSSR